METSIPDVKFDRFYHYAELTRILKSYAKEFSNLTRMESIGKSHEGRDVWFLTTAKFKSGSDGEKRAFWVDGNIHAADATASWGMVSHLFIGDTI